MDNSQSRALGPRLRTPAAAKYLGIAESTLEKMRVSGAGPEYEVVGKAVVYSIPALEDYLAQRRVRSTSETQTSTSRPPHRKKSCAPPGDPDNGVP
jgi:hypothetical protein